MEKENLWGKKGQNHRMIWVSQILQLQPLCPGQGHFPLDKIIQNLIKPGLEHFQGICKIAVTHRGNELLPWKFLLVCAHFQSCRQPSPSPAGREEVSGCETSRISWTWILFPALLHVFSACAHCWTSHSTFHGSQLSWPSLFISSYKAASNLHLNTYRFSPLFDRGKI